MTRAVMFFIVGLLVGVAIGYDAGRRGPELVPSACSDLSDVVAIVRADRASLKDQIAALEAQANAAIVQAQRVEDVLAERLRLTGKPNPRPSRR